MIAQYVVLRELSDVEQPGHAFALHAEVIVARAAELAQEREDGDFDLAHADAVGEAVKMAAAEISWSENWWELIETHAVSIHPPDLHEDLIETIAEFHWVDSMPPLGG